MLVGQPVSRCDFLQWRRYLHRYDRCQVPRDERTSLGIHQKYPQQKWQSQASLAAVHPRELVFHPMAGPKLFVDAFCGCLSVYAALASGRAEYILCEAYLPHASGTPHMCGQDFDHWTHGRPRYKVGFSLFRPRHIFVVIILSLLVEGIP